MPCLKSSAATEPHSATLISLMYINGYGVGKNFDIAKKWLEQSSEEAKKILFHIMDVHIPESMQKDKDIVHTTVSSNFESFTLYGFMGLTREEEESFFQIS